MYISVRGEHYLQKTFGTLKAGLDAMGLNNVELEYLKDRTVLSLDGTDGATISLATESDVDAFIRHCSVLGCNVSALLLHNNFAAEDFDAEVDWAISSIKAANRIGAKAVRVDAIMSTELEWPLEKRVQRFVDCMGKIIDATNDCDVEMGIENHGVKGNEPEFLDMVLGEVNSPRLGVTIDIANFYWYGHPLGKVYEIIEHLAPRVKHTHIKNIGYPADMREIQRELGYEYGTYVSPLRDGDIDIPRVIKTLKSAGYKGDLCIEDESVIRWDVEKCKEVLVDDAVYMREILNIL